MRSACNPNAISARHGLRLRQLPARLWVPAASPEAAPGLRHRQHPMQLHAADHPEAASTNTSSTSGREPPKVLDWESLKTDIHANASSPYLFAEDDEDDEDEDIIAFRNYARYGWAAEEAEEAQAQAARAQAQAADESGTVSSPVASPSAASEAPPAVSAYTAAGGFRDVGPEELHNLIQELGAGYAPRFVLLLDIRSKAQYETSRVPGAYSLPFQELSSAVRSGLLLGWVKRTVVVVGDTDMIAAQASVRLRRVFGFEEVVCMRGGMPAWEQAGLPCASGPDTLDWSEVFSSAA